MHFFFLRHSATATFCAGEVSCRGRTKRKLMRFFLNSFCHITRMFSQSPFYNLVHQMLRNTGALPPVDEVDDDDFPQPPRRRHGGTRTEPIDVDDDNPPRSPGPIIEEVIDEDDVPELSPTLQRPPRYSPQSPPVHQRRNVPIQHRPHQPPYLIEDEEAEFPPREEMDHDAQIQEALKQSLEESERTLRKRERDELEAAYQDSLESDRQKERKAQADQRKKQEEAQAEQRKKHEEEKKKEKAKTAAEEEKELYAQLRKDLAQKADSLPPEPPADDTDAVTVAVRLVGGHRTSRRFPSSTLFLYVKEWVDSELGRALPEDSNAQLLHLITSNYDLGTDFPKKIYGDDCLEKTLKELEFPKRVLLNISQR